ncbi:MAG: metal-dependent transcriptional regulator [Anaerolineae bacterium]|nr:metal-dependent transcriptional regulator [Anaerolineae bacterium]
MAHHNLDDKTMSESIEMYLLRIALLRREGQPVPIPVLAQEMAVSPVSANEMCRRLVDKGLIEYEPYRGVSLTAKAEALARRVLRNRRLWEVFFAEKLGIDPLEADEMACRFEHVTPDDLANRLAVFLGHPTLTPQNQLIPYDDQPLPERSVRPLTTLAAGEKGQVSRIGAAEPVKNFLCGYGLCPGVAVTTLAVAADGALLLDIAGQALSLSKPIAAAIDITVID